MWGGRRRDIGAAVLLTFYVLISKPLKILSQTFETKVLQRFSRTQPLKQRFLKFLKDAIFRKQRFSKIFKGWNRRAEPNGLSTMVFPRLLDTVRQ